MQMWEAVIAVEGLVYRNQTIQELIRAQACISANVWGADAKLTDIAQFAWDEKVLDVLREEDRFNVDDIIGKSKGLLEGKI